MYRTGDVRSGRNSNDAELEKILQAGCVTKTTHRDPRHSFLAAFDEKFQKQLSTASLSGCMILDWPFRDSVLLA